MLKEGAFVDTVNKEGVSKGGEFHGYTGRDSTKTAFLYITYVYMYQFVASVLLSTIQYMYMSLLV